MYVVAAFSLDAVLARGMMEEHAALLPADLSDGCWFQPIADGHSLLFTNVVTGTNWSEDC
jgi:hypothetical protein